MLTLVVIANAQRIANTSVSDRRPCAAEGQVLELTHSSVSLRDTTTHAAKQTSHGRTSIEAVLDHRLDLARSKEEHTTLGRRFYPRLQCKRSQIFGEVSEGNTSKKRTHGMRPW